MKLALPSMIVLAVVTAVCSYFKLAFVPYLVSAAVVVVILLVVFKKIPEKSYPIYLVGLSVSMLWQQTMLGSYIVGTDIHQEFYMVNRTIEQGWDWNYWCLNGTSVVLNVVAPALYKIGIPVVWQFKLLFPLCLAFVPWILYVAFSRQISKRYGFFAAIFFIIVPVFTVEIATITKSMVAELFFALTVLILFTQMKNWKKFLLLCLCGILATLCHYTVGTLIFGYLGITAVILLVYGIFKRKWNFSPILAATLVIGVIGGLWFYSTGGGIVYRGYTNSYSNVLKRFTEIDIIPQVVNPSTAVSSPSVAANNTPQKQETQKPFTYLKNQDSLIRTALGIDWNDTSIEGKAFRVIQYITQLAVVLGVILLLFNRKKYNVSAELVASVIACGALLVSILFVPRIGSILNTTRWYHSALFFISPLLVIGIARIGKERLVAGVLIVYYLFTCGLVYTLNQSDVPNLTLESPYSVAYSWQQGMVGIFNEDDIACAKWMKDNIGDKKCHTGFVDTYLFLGYMEFKGQFVEKAPQEPHYLFLSSQNNALKRMTSWTEPGMRKMLPLPDTSRMKEVFRQGSSVVYYAE